MDSIVRLLPSMVLVATAVLYVLYGGEERQFAGVSGATLHAAGGDAVTFAVIGDYGDGSMAEARVAALVDIMAPDLVITVGDNVYPRALAGLIDRNIGRYYSHYIRPYKGQYGKGSPDVNRFFPAIGNHDWPPVALLDYFELPGNERYYDFVWGPVHFFAIDTNEGEMDGIGPDSAQALWLRRKLAASSSPFKIVYGHHPPYSSGKHGSAEAIRWPFAEWGADAFMAGHDHTYERLTVDGIPYFVVGLSGRSIYPFGAVIDESEFRHNGSYGALLVKVEGKRADFRFYDISGAVIDEFEVVRK